MGATVEMKIKILSNEDKNVWDQFVKLSPVGNIYHLWGWGELQKKLGYKPIRLGVIKNGNLVLACQILLSKQGFLGTFASSSYGPIFQDFDDIELKLEYLTKFFTSQSKIYDFAGFELQPLFFSQKTQTSPQALTLQKSEKDNLLANLSEDYLTTILQKNEFTISGKNPTQSGFIDLEKETTQLLNSQPKTTRKLLKSQEKSKYKYFEFNITNVDKYTKFLNIVSSQNTPKSSKLLALLPEYFDKNLVIAYFSKDANLDNAKIFVLLHKQPKLATILDFYEVASLSTEHIVTFFWELFLNTKNTSKYLFFEEKLVVYLKPFFEIKTIPTSSLILKLNPLKYSFLESGNLLSNGNWGEFKSGLALYLEFVQAKFIASWLLVKSYTKTTYLKYFKPK